MIEVLFDESEAGSMRMAKSMKRRGDGGNVVEMTFHLDIGEIKMGLTSEARKKQYVEYFDVCQWRDADQHPQREIGWSYLVSEVERLKSCAAKGEPIRIWYSDAPYSLCGFYQVCTILQDYDCPVSVVKLPEYVHRGGPDFVIYKSWNEVDHKEMLDFAFDEKRLTKYDLEYYGGLWARLQRENASLRAVINGRLISVPDDFYDFLIENRLQERPFREVELLGHVVSTQLNAPESWIMERIHKMIDDGRLVAFDDENVEWLGERLLRTKDAMVSCCGVNCLECEYFGSTCGGCDKIKGKPFWLEYTGDEACDIYHCCINEKKYKHCGICMLRHCFIEKKEYCEDGFEPPCNYYGQEDPTKTGEENEDAYKKQIKMLKKLCKV